VMPVLREADPHSGRGAPDNPHYMAICHMGLGPPGTLPKVPMGLTHLLVTIDKFTKWIDARPLVNIGPKQAMDFIQDIIFALESLTPSSQIMALSSSRKNFWISMVTTTSGWIGLW
jgi:hypothetical protein